MKRPMRFSPRRSNSVEDRTNPREWALIAAVAILAHGSALTGGFIWLDHGDIEEGAAISPPTRVWTLFARGFGRTGFYRPFQALSLSIDSWVGPAWMFHATSLVFHAAAAVMVAVIAQRLWLEKRAAIVAGLFFSVHPVTSVVAGAISYRADEIITVALLGMLWAHAEKRPWLAAGAMVLGGLSKETALVLGPVFLMAFELLGRGDEHSKGSKRVLFAAEAVAWVFCVSLRVLFAPPWNSRHFPLGLSDAVGTRLAAFFQSVGRLLWPFDTSLCDAFPIQPWVSDGALVGGLLLTALVVLAWRMRGPWVFAALAFVPSFQLIPTPRFWSPHYLYLPWAFLAIACVQAGFRFHKQLRWPALGVFAVCAGLSFWQGFRYRSDLTLFEPEIVRRPECLEGRLYLGDAHRQAGALDAAVLQYEVASTPNPSFLAYVDTGAALQNLGLVRLQQRRFEEAASAMERARPYFGKELDQRKLTHNLATVELARGNDLAAEQLLRSETERSDALRESMFIRARALAKLGRDDEAKALLVRLGVWWPKSKTR
jgi:hypothetical protein